MKLLSPMWFLLGCMALAQPGLAQALRDPTVPPAEAGVGAEGGDAGPAVDPLKGPFPVINVNGKAHIVVGTRLYHVGQKIGTVKVERITESEVWLRDADGLRKIPNYPGIERRPHVPPKNAPQPKGQS